MKCTRFFRDVALSRPCRYQTTSTHIIFIFTPLRTLNFLMQFTHNAMMSSKEQNGRGAYHSTEQRIHYGTHILFLSVLFVECHRPLVPWWLWWYYVAPDTLPVVCVVPARLLPAAGSHSRGKLHWKLVPSSLSPHSYLNIFQVPNIWREYISCRTCSCNKRFLKAQTLNCVFVYMHSILCLCWMHTFSPTGQKFSCKFWGFHNSVN